MALTNKQRAFVEEYLRTRNATESAKRAGYSLKSAYSIGAENLTKPEIKTLIAARLDEMKIEADTVVGLLVDHAMGTMEDFVTVGPDGKKEIDLHKAKRLRKMHLLKKVKETKRVTENYTETTLEIELHDPQSAMIALGKYHRLFVERHEHTGKDGGAIEVNDVKSVLAQRLADRAARSGTDSTAGNVDGSGSGSATV